MLVSEIMNTDIKTIKSSSTVRAAAIMMNKHRIGGLLVTKKNGLEGIITERDIMKNIVAQAKDSSKVLVKDIMRTELVVIEEDRTIEDAAKIMLEAGVKKLPVVKDKALVGIITSTDILAAQPKQIEIMSKILVFPKEKRPVAG